MSPADNSDSDSEGEEIEVVTDVEEPAPEGDGDVRKRLEEEADKAVDQFDDRIVDLLAWLLDTETRARIYVHLRKHPHSTSEEIAQGTGLYPSTVREALAELHEEETLTRRKRESDGAGNNPYEYAAIAPSELVSDAVGDVQAQLNTVFNMDSHLAGDDEELETDEPVTISVNDAVDDEDEESWESKTGDGANEEATDDTDDDANEQT